MVKFEKKFISVHLNKCRCTQGYPLLSFLHYLRTGITTNPAPNAHASDKVS